MEVLNHASWRRGFISTVINQLIHGESPTEPTENKHREAFATTYLPSDLRVGLEAQVSQKRWLGKTRAT